MKGSMRCYRRWELRFELCTSNWQLYFCLEDWGQCSEWLTFLHRSVEGSQLSSSLESDHDSGLFQHLIWSFERQWLWMGRKVALAWCSWGKLWYEEWTAVGSFLRRVRANSSTQLLTRSGIQRPGWFSVKIRKQWICLLRYLPGPPTMPLQTPGARFL